MILKIGSLCSGYGGLDLAVEAVLDARTAWVDVITGGTPCQDLSHAGKRAGMTEGTRSNLWVSMREAIATIRPRLVIWENVGGAYSAAADSDMESREGRLGDRPGRPALRALGRVLGDLASLGYVGGWHGLRAADVGAPHGRLRVFVVAVPDAERGRLAGWTREAGREARGRVAARAAVRLLPTPRVENNENRQSEGYGGKDGNFHGLITGQTPWGQYADAIARWESVTREAPAPTEIGTKGNPRLSPLFTEWMMGLPAGWINDVPDVTRNEALKLCGNGVVPQQAEAALRYLLPLIGEQVAA